MSDPRVMGKAIADYVLEKASDKREKLERILTDREELRIIVCGLSGSGKSLSIEAANELLPDDQQIEEVNEVLWKDDIEGVASVIEDHSMQLPNRNHIAFNMVNKELAAEMESRGTKVFWFKLISE